MIKNGKLKHYTLLRYIGTIIFFLLVSLYTFASEQPEEEAEESVKLDTVVVTGTRTEKRLKDTPVITEVISK